MQRVGIHWYEPFNNRFQGGLEIGYIDILQTQNPQTSAQVSSGQYLGLLLRFLLVNKSKLALNINLNYRYNRTDGVSTLQDTKFIWYEGLLSNELQYKTTEKTTLSLAAEYQTINGRLQTNETSPAIKTFKIKNPYGVKVALKYKLSSTEVIGFDWVNGYKTGGKLYFGRIF